ncbi:MAG: YadA-like family protein [Phascolarctobacterium sp.]|nr:YadA-like family protein [Phascolarctobacterium sp.]
MKKLFGKALAMAVMMSVLAGGSAYAENSVIVYRPAGGFYDMDGSPAIRISQNSSVEGKSDSGTLSTASLSFIDFAYSNLPVATYGNRGIVLDDHAGHAVVLNNYQGLNMGNLAIKGVSDIIATGNAEIGGNLTVTGTLNATIEGYVEKGTTNTTDMASIAVGSDAKANGHYAIAVGMSTANGVSSVAIGGITEKDYSTALGRNAKTFKENDVAVGYRSATGAENATAIGYQASVYDTATNSVAIGANSEAYEENTVSIGTEGAERKIVNVAAGENDTDAVNYSQIKAVDGNYVKADKTVAENFTALDNQVKTNADDIATLKTDLDAKADKSYVDTELGKKADKTYVDTELGKKADQTYVDTELDKKANAADVYTKSQTDAAIAAATYDDTAIKADIAKKADKTDLDAKADKSALETEATTRQDADDNLQSQIDTLSSSASAGMSELASKINQTDARVDRVGATAAALAAINYQPMAKGQSQVAIGMGGYNGKKATAIGLAYQFDNRISGSVAGAANGSERMFNVGFNYLFGQHSAKDIAAMAATPGSMSLTEAELRAENKAQNNQIQAMQAEIAELKAMVKALAAK